jgi:6,7-dimethyl-8-ribityllumazine synthase
MIESSDRGEGRRVALVISRFNDFVTTRLRAGAVKELEARGVVAADIDEMMVPGAFEIPLAARLAAGTGRYAAVICLGAIIRGDTPHFDYIAAACAQGVSRVSLDTGLPCIFGVLTTDTAEQALERSGGYAGDKGRDAARAALEMAGLAAALKGA